MLFKTREPIMPYIVHLIQTATHEQRWLRKCGRCHGPRKNERKEINEKMKVEEGPILRERGEGWENGGSQSKQ